MIKAHHSGIQQLESLLLKQCFRTEFHTNKYFLLPEFVSFFFFSLERGIFRAHVIEYNKSDSLVVRGQFALQSIGND